MSISSDITRIKGAKADLKTAINAKGGTITNELIDEYADAVDAIVVGVDTSDATATADSLLYGHTAYGAAGTKLTGAGAWWQYATGLYLAFENTGIQGVVAMRVPNAKYLRSAFAGSTSITSIDLTIGASVTTMVSFAAECTSLVVVTLSDPLASCNSFLTAFSGCVALQTISNAINMASSGNNGYAFRNCYALANISFVPSTIKVTTNFEASPLLSNASLLSIANGLDAASPNTLKMHATSKTNMDNIMVDNVDGTAVLGTTMSLATFITTIKGWTIA